MLHKIILNIALTRQLTTIYAVTMLCSHISSYKVELYVNHNLLKGDESLIFYRRYCILGWVVSFCGEELFGQIQCLRINKQHKSVGKRVLWSVAWQRWKNKIRESSWWLRFNNSVLHRSSGCNDPRNFCLLGRQMDNSYFGAVGRLLIFIFTYFYFE